MKKWMGILTSLIFITIALLGNNCFVCAATGDLAIINYETSVEQIISDQSFTLKLDVANLSTQIYDLVYLIVDKNNESSFRVKDGNNRLAVGTNFGEENNKNASISVEMVYNGGSNLNIPIIIGYVDGGEPDETTVNIIRIDNIENGSTQPTDTSKYTPRLSISDSSIPTIKAGDSTKISFTVQNISKYTAKNVVVTPTVDSNVKNYIFFNSLNPSQTISTILSNRWESTSLKFRTSTKCPEGTYPIEIKYEYENIYGNQFTASNTIYIKILNNSPDNNILPKVTIEDLTYNPQTIPNGSTFDLQLSLLNAGSLEAKDIKVSLQGLKEDMFSTVNGTNNQYILSMNGGGKKKISYKLMAAEKLAKGNYGITIKLEYKDQWGKDYSDEQQFFIPVYSEEVNVKTVPKIILEKYSCNPSIVRAGENFILNMSFINTSEAKGVRNIKIYLTVNEASNEGGNLFTPVNSSNTFFISSIEPKGKASQTLEFFTIPDAKAKTYTMVANFEYEDIEGNEYKSTELIGVPVQQKTRLETTEVSFPPEAYPGQPVPVGFDFYNMGKVTLNNLMIKLEGEFDAPNSNYFVGNFEPGSTDHYEGAITPRGPGVLNGAVVISYDDPAGQHVELKRDFSFNVVEMPQPQPGPGEKPGVEPGAPKQGGFKKILKSPFTWIGLGVVVIAAVIFIRKAVIKKREGMTLDE